MRVKVGAHWYDPSVTPIMVELSMGDKALIGNMEPGTVSLYAEYPDTMSEAEAKAWMGPARSAHALKRATDERREDSDHREGA